VALCLVSHCDTVYCPHCDIVCGSLRFSFPFTTFDYLGSFGDSNHRFVQVARLAYHCSMKSSAHVSSECFIYIHYELVVLKVSVSSQALDFFFCWVSHCDII
jgi:hypothetical protein